MYMKRLNTELNFVVKEQANKLGAVIKQETGAEASNASKQFATILFYASNV